jgi:hypothetical protein
MTVGALAITLAVLIGLVGLAFILLNIHRGNAEVSTPGGFTLKGSVGLLLLLVGFGAAGYLLNEPVNSNACLIFCPAPALQQTKKFDFPAQDTRADDGITGHMKDIHVSLLSPDEKHPLGQFIATWIYSGGGGGSQQGSQSVNIRMKGAGDADLPSPAPLPLDRSGCHSGGIRQTFQQDLQTPFAGVDHVLVQPGVVEGKVEPC